MTSGAMFVMIERQAKDYRLDCKASLKRNEHMHKLRRPVSQDAIDAILVGFINYMASRPGMDLGLYTKHLEEK